MLLSASSIRSAVTACGAKRFKSTAASAATSSSSAMSTLQQLVAPEPTPPAAPGQPSRFTKDVSNRIYNEVNRGLDVWSMFNPVVFPTAVNLGQGFMSFGPPTFITDALKDAGSEKKIATHHYSHPRGRPVLRNAIRDFYSPSFRKPESIESDRQVGAKALQANGSGNGGGSSASATQSNGKGNANQPEGAVGLPRRRPDEGRALDVESEIQVTAGANTGIYCATLAFVNPGDRILMFEPFFDQYICEATFHDGEPVFIPLSPPSAPAPAAAEGKKKVPYANDWSVDWDAVEEAMAHPRSKVFILNTPNNPIGKVFSLDELQKFAALAIKYDLMVIADEVYDSLVFDGLEHIRVASLEGMWERTVTVGSAGKTFACTGWRIGWCIGPQHLISPILSAHTRICFCCNSAASEAAGIGLAHAAQSDFFPRQVAEYDERRQRLCNIFSDLGLTYHWPSGSYFVMVDLSAIEIPAEFDFPEDIRARDKSYQMAWFVAKTADVVGIPATAFASTEGAKHFEQYVRFSFCKTETEFSAAEERLQKLKPYLKKV